MQNYSLFAVEDFFSLESFEEDDSLEPLSLPDESFDDDSFEPESLEPESFDDDSFDSLELFPDPSAFFPSAELGLAA